MSSGGSLPPVESVPSPAAPLKPFVVKPARPKMTPRGTRLTASTLVLIAAIVLAVSMAVSWWGASSTGGGPSLEVGFLPGSSYTFSSSMGTGTSGSQLYSNAGLVHVGHLYQAVLGVLVVAALAGFAAMVLGYLGALGTFRSRRYMQITLVLTIISAGGAILLPALVAASQPSAFTADGTGFSGAAGAGCGTGTTPCNSFWGSVSGGGTTVSWGADVGWYLSVAAAVLLVIALVQFLQTRKSPYTRDEVRPATVALPPALTGAATPPPPSEGTTAAASAAGPMPGSYCPRCGSPMAWVPQYSRYFCMTERTYV
jgi:hypothetical protein